MTPYLLAVAITVLPLCLGFALGWALRRRYPQRFSPGWLTWAVLAIPLLAALLLPPYCTGLSPWDLAALSCLLSVGFLAACQWSQQITGAGPWKVSLVVVASLIVLEIGARLGPAPPIHFPEPGQARLFFRTADGVPPDEEFKTRLAFPARFMSEAPAAMDSRGVILHLGDSMVQGTGAARNQQFTTFLNQIDSSRTHINLGMADTGPDYYWLTASNWSKSPGVEKVVFYIFMGNDLRDLGRDYVMCGNEKLYEEVDGGFRLRCREPEFGGLSLPRLLSAPAPYAWRVATSFSAAARVAAALPKLLYERLERLRDDGAGVGRLARIIGTASQEMSGRGIETAVVLLPYRRALEEGGELAEVHRDLHRQAVEQLATHGQSTWDAWDFFTAQVNQLGADQLFLDDVPGDVHLSARGHRLLADWLVAHDGF